MKSNPIPSQMSFIRHTIRGCGRLPHCGAHPGTPLLYLFVSLGAAMGSYEGVVGALVGAGFMLAWTGPLYLWGAYDRSKLVERLDKSASV